MMNLINELARSRKYGLKNEYRSDPVGAVEDIRGCSVPPIGWRIAVKINDLPNRDI